MRGDRFRGAPSGPLPTGFSRRAERAVRYTIMVALLVSHLPSSVSAQGARQIQVGAVRVPLPPGAEVVPHPHGRSRFGGIRVRLEERLTLELAVLPASATPLQAYVDSLARARNAHLRASWHLEPATAAAVAGRTVWVLRPRCGDCDAVEVYLDFPGTRLVVDWGVDGLEALTVAQRHALAWRFIASLRPARPAG
jgi:hypothetical protein